MTSIGESSSAMAKPVDEKPVVVRVKRKVFQSRLDAFWLEISERPLKRPLLDFENLSLSQSSGKEPEELKTKKVFVQHVETLRSSEATVDVVQSFMDHDASDTTIHKVKSEERRKNFKKEQIQDQLLVKARQEQEVLAKNARFEQIWRSRKGSKEAMHHKLHEVCHFYDVVRVDAGERSNEVPHQEYMSLEDRKILSSYLPLLRECIPRAATEIESDIRDYISKQVFTDDYVYDYYTVKHDTSLTEDDDPFPLVQVDDEDFYDVPYESEYESDDSNAEGNPLNDYPDEMSDEEGESDSEASDDESEDDETDSLEHKNSESEDYLSEEGSRLCANVTYEDYDGDEIGFGYDDDSGDDEDWR